MEPSISLPRQHGGSANFGSTPPTGRGEGLRMPRFFKRYLVFDRLLEAGRLVDDADIIVISKRLFSFRQLDWEMAIWEMTNLLVAPKKVFRSMYYHVWLTSYGD